jgi:tetratricopeptide (TPR) repeat protein
MVAGAIAAAHALRHGAALTHLSTYGLGARLVAMVYACIVSLFRFVWPASLSPLYEMPARINLLEPRFGFALLVAVLLTGLLIRLRRVWPAGLAAWIFSALMLAPVSVAVRQGADLAPDRYSYLAGLGFAVVAGGAALPLIRLVRLDTFSRSTARLVGITAVVGIVALAFTSWSYAVTWRDSATLWRWAVDVDPTCSVCHGKLGESDLSGPDGARQAELSFRRAIAGRPDLPDAYFNLGSALVIQGRYAEAEEPLRRYVAQAPEGAIDAGRLGLRYLNDARYGAAIPFLRTAVGHHPDASALRASLVAALKGHALELRAQGQAAEADRLAVESQAFSNGRRSEPASR